MANIQKRARAGGRVIYRAEIRLKRRGRVVYQESRSFDRREDAKSWATAREAELQKPGGIESVQIRGWTLAALAQKYLAYIEELGPVNRGKAAFLERLPGIELGSVLLEDLTAADIIDHCRRRALAGTGPSTVDQEVNWVGELLRIAKPVFRLPVATGVIQEARPILKQLKLVGRSKSRRRRLEGDEEERLMDYFGDQQALKKTLVPMAEIMPFAIASCMRQGEICRIRWEDISEDRRTVVIRDRKDPNEKEGRDEEVPLLGEAWGIATRQPRRDEAIFPYQPRSVSARFTRACQRLGIHELRFHDLRRTGATRLLEAGYSVPEVIRVTGHRDWNQFRRYVALRPEDLHR